MQEVIDLLSSPENSPPKAKQTTVRRPQARSRTDDIFNVDSYDFNLSSSPEDLGVPSAQPKKKRRLSPPEQKPTKTKPSRILSFLSSSDDLDDVLAAETTGIGKTIAVTKSIHVEELLSDPITFSSSAPEPRTVGRAAKSAVIELHDDGPTGEDVFSLSQPSAAPRPHLSERTANLLANIAGPRKGSSKYTSFTHTVASKPTTTSTTPMKGTIAKDDIFTSSPPKPKRKSSKAPGKDKDAREAERAATKAKREEVKEVEQERKRLAKEEKAREKQRAADVAEVNKSKIDKKNSTPEMMVDMARSLEGTSVGNQVLEYMKILGVETTFFDEQLGLSGSTETANLQGNLVRWRRKVKARYDEEVGRWEPIPAEKIEIEKHILVHITAREFLEVAVSGLPPNQDPATQEKAMTRNLDSHVASLRSRYKACKPIYLIEGLSAFLRKNKTAQNRAYAAAVRSQMADPDQANPPTSSQPRRKTKNTNPTTPHIDLSTITPDLTESLLLHLQLHTQILLHHSPTPSLSATWIKSFTEHISTIPYRHIRMRLNDAVGFCMDVGQVKTGEDRLDTYVKMLQEVQRVTPAMAWGIATRYDALGGLVQAFREGGPLVLRDIRKSTNKDGGLSERELGQKVSRRLFKVWTGREAGSTDGIA